MYICIQTTRGWCFSFVFLMSRCCAPVSARAQKMPVRLCVCESFHTH